MEKNYNTELDFVLEELIVAYENQFRGVNFYAEDSHKTIKEEISQKVADKFGLKDWEINLLYQNLLIDNNIKSIEPISISLGGLVFRNNGGYTQRDLRLNSENLRIQTVENDLRKSSRGLMIFTALLAFGTLISAWYFAIEVWKFYNSPLHP
ncbi:MAG: hypothetical protein A3F72_06815 [Bacteroidetes bacterium RIFCSPLOWO2_12_FULL_35_15]|nr:MAG: hypothetical protein A3F72_06815 [Bacteroidetes bacterium RIFCSPLOWO2_12_FULL_35_15]